MSEKKGRILIDASWDLNIPQEKIYELGNWTSVALITDVPDIHWTFPWQERHYWHETEEWNGTSTS